MEDVIKRTHKRKKPIEAKDKQKKNPSQNDWQNEKNALYV